jgi:hypothetical protein
LQKEEGNQDMYEKVRYGRLSVRSKVSRGDKTDLGVGCKSEMKR